MIFISAGHTSNKSSKNYDSGAVGNGHKEADLAVMLRDKAFDKIIALGGKATKDDDRKSLREYIASINSTEGDVICDIHFNAATPQATGVEVFHPFRSTMNERILADTICKSFSEIMVLKSRGIKDETQSQHKSLGIMKPKGTNVLIEVCFISNANDVKQFLANVDKLADKLANLLVDSDKLIA